MFVRRFTGIALTAVVFVGSGAWLAAGIRVGAGGGDEPIFHVDEAHKPGESFYYHLLFEKRAPRDPAWREDFYSRTNPPVAKYVFGAVLAAAGYPVRDQQLQHDFDAMADAPEELRRRVPDGMLRVTRGISVVFAAALCALLFVLCRRVSGTPAGLLAVLLLLGNPLFTLWACRGMTDTILMFNLVLIVPVTILAVRTLRNHWRRPVAGGAVRAWIVPALATVLLPGLAIALAAGTKLNGSLTGPAYATALVAAALVCAGSLPLWRRLALAIGAAALAAVTAVALFVALDPYYHEDTIGRLLETRRIWNDWTVVQQVAPGEGLFTPYERLIASGYYSLHAPALPLSRLLSALRAPLPGNWLMILGFTAGLVALAGRALSARQAADGDDADAAVPDEAARLDTVVVLCWVLVCAIGITLWLPLSWERYLLPAYLAVCTATAIGLAAVGRLIGAIVMRLAGARAPLAAARLTGGSVLAGGLWAVLTFALPDPFDPSTPSCTLRTNVGVALLELGLYKPAAQQCEQLLSLLDRENPASRATRIRRCRVLHALAEARIGMGDADGATDALAQYISISQGLRDEMQSDDPYVLAAHEQRIAAARARLAAQASGAGHGAPGSGNSEEASGISSGSSLGEPGQ